MKSTFSPKSARNVAEATTVDFNQSVVMNTTSTNVPALATSQAVADLTQNEMKEVRALRQKLQDRTKLAMYADDCQKEMTKIAEAVLEHTKATDLDFVTTKMTDIIVQAKGITAEPSKAPLIGGFINAYRNKKERVLANFDTAKAQIGKIVDEVSGYEDKIAKRLVILEQQYDANVVTARRYKLHEIAVRMEKEELDQQIEIRARELTNTVNPDPWAVQELQDARSHSQQLDILISNLERQQLSAVQKAPAIRLMQQNGTQLLSTFVVIKSEVIPNWMTNFAIGLGLEEQQKGANLANTILDANNALMRQNADMLHTTTVAVGKTNQRGVVDMETLEHVQSKLLTTIDDMRKIAEEGKQARAAASARMVEMKQELKQKLV